MSQIPVPQTEIDARGLICPLPVLRLRKRLQALPSGAIARLLADDPVAVLDIPHFCAESGHRLISAQDEAGTQIYLIEKG